MRASVESIRNQRSPQRSVILFTGGTSFLGGRIAAELLKRRYPLIFLCRPKDGLEPPERIRRALRWFGYQGPDHYEVVEGELTLPRFGLSDQAYVDLTQRVDEVFHGAANTSFLEDQREEAEKVNVQGTYTVLKLAPEGRCGFFHHMSTAYVAGAKQGLCPEEFVPQTAFHNPYEHTKHKAEGLVLETCRRLGIRANIYRPSVVCGDSTTGRSLIFSAIYFPIRTIHYLQRVFERDLDGNRGQLAAKMGIRRDADGKTFMPIRYEKTEGSLIDVIPIDFLARACLAIMDHCLDGDVFHIGRKGQQSIEEIIQFTERYLNVRGLEGVPKEQFDREPRRALEKIFDSYLDVYHPYLHDLRTFDDAKAGRILRECGITCPELTYEVFERCMDYALKVNWGEKIFDDVDQLPIPKRSPLAPLAGRGAGGEGFWDRLQAAATPRGAEETTESPGETYSADAIQSWLRRKVAEKLDLPGDEIDVDEPIIFLGVTSLDATSISGELGDWLSISIPQTVIYDHETIRELSEYLAEVKLSGAGAGGG